MPNLENLYFPIFLVAMALLVIWVFHKSKKGMDRREDLRHQRRTRARRQAARRTHRADSSMPSVNPPAASGIATSEKMWASRKRRANYRGSSAYISGEAHGTLEAGYLGPDKPRGERIATADSISDQKISKLDYVGFDEYLARERAEARRSEAAQSDEFSMTAVKYESPGEASDEEGVDNKQAGFKP